MNKKWFSLPELLVTISILTILWAIWYFSYLSYTIDSRDSNRVNQLKTIWDWIDLVLSRGISLVPENSLEIFVDWEKYSTQWELSNGIVSRIKYFWNWLDPRTNMPFVFSLSANNRNYDLFSLLEDPKNSPKQALKESFVYDNSGRLPYVYWKNVTWIITDNNYSPINYTLSWTLDLDCDIDEWYKLIFDNWKILSSIMWQSDFEFWPCYDESAPSLAWPSTPITYDNLSDLLSGSCNINEATFAANFNPITWVYNWNIVCNWSWIDDASLVFFNVFRWVTWNFNLSNNFITNLNPLVNLESVWGVFSLNNNQIINANSLATRSSNNFININLSNNQLTNLEWVRNLNSLEILNLSNNNLTNISAISSLNSLVNLDLSNNNLTDISSIWWRNTLVNLNLSNNNISNITSLFWLNNLSILNLSDNNISSVNALRQSNSLTYLNLSWNDSLNNLSDLNTISSINRTLQLSNRNYSWKIQSTSPICNNWTILSHNWNIFPNNLLICNELTF